ncbi:MAG TPA: ATP-binding cassette domain-containing protein [Steroidobacteraceae bacterium]|nr:ATP-binding cassette domain-containing protein [Steroidobacteraceae bacterium]
MRGVVNRFGRQVVHDGLDVDVRAGEVFGIVGGSGSGKSVLLRTMLGLQRPKAGSVRIEGREVVGRPARELLEVKRRYGVMFQRGALFTSLTVAQNVELPIRENFEVPEPLLGELAALRIRMVGLGDDAGAKYPAQLSGGMTKRAALARALALDPAILFLDEPTSGLDPISAAAFDELVLGLQRGLGLTVVMITHDLDTIFRVCNRVGVIVEGRMIAGTLDEIVRNDHPWIRDYFHGERSRAPRSEARSDG